MTGSQGKARDRPNDSQDHALQRAQMNQPPVEQIWSTTTVNDLVPDRAARIRQGNCYGYYDCWYQGRTNFYAAADTWRSSPDGTNNLRTATSFQSKQRSHPSYNENAQQQMNPSSSKDLAARELVPQPLQNPRVHPPPRSAPLHQAQIVGPLPSQPYGQSQHSHFTPYQPLRSVQSYARYPEYRVNKSYRVSNGERERQVIQHAPSTSPTERASAPSPKPLRYNFRRRRPDQVAPFSSEATTDVSIRYMETNRSSLSPRSYGVPSTTKSRTWTAEVQSPPAPHPSKDYKSNAGLPPVLRDVPAKLLVILDLNGTLLVRPIKTQPKHILVRPGVAQLLDYLFSNHVVMIYSSAKPENCAAIINKFFTEPQRNALAAVWARDKLGLTQVQYNNKVQVYKKLEPIWAEPNIRLRAGPGRKWDQRNTVLVDDSQLKALAQPHNLLQVPEFLNNAPKGSMQALLDWHRGEEAVVYSIQQKLEELKWQVDVSRLIREWQTGKRQAPGVVDETMDQKAFQGIPDHAPSPSPSPSIGDRETSAQRQLLSPEHSLMSISGGETKYEPEEDHEVGVSHGNGEESLDHLEQAIDRNLSLNVTVPSPDRNRSQNTGAASAAGIEAIQASGDPQLGRQSELPASTQPSADLIRGS